MSDNDAEKAVETVNDEKNESPVENKPIPMPRFFPSMRFFMAFLAFWGYFIMLMFKTDLTIGIVCMVNYTGLRIQAFLANPNLTPTPIDPSCYFKPVRDSRADGPYIWSKNERGLTLSAFFWGYILAHIPSGWIADRYGARILLIVANFFASAFTITGPLFSDLGYLPFAFNRAAVGFFLGAFLPGLASLFVQWTPPGDRNKIVGASFSGGILGSVFAYLIGSVLCDKGFAGGYGSIFYIFGAIGLFWSVALFIFASDSPETNRFISDAEKEYILKATEKEALSRHTGLTKKKTPWKAILTSRICLATFATVFCQGIGHITFLTEIPTYLREVLHFSIVTNGLAVALPQVFLAISILGTGLVSDILYRKNIMKKVNIRRLASSIGLLLPAAGCVAVLFVTCADPYAAIVILGVVTFFTGSYWGAGVFVNINDFAGGYAGLVNGICQVFASLPGIFFPYVIGTITTDETRGQWNIVFIICAVMYVMSAVIFVIFADSDLQPWAIGEDTSSASDTLFENKVAPLKPNDVEESNETRI